MLTVTHRDETNERYCFAVDLAPDEDWDFCLWLVENLDGFYKWRDPLHRRIRLTGEIEVHGKHKAALLRLIWG